MAIELGLT